MGTTRRTLIERFWSHVRPEPGDKCWMWSAAKGHNGYGLIKDARSGKKRMTRAHRLSWEIAYGPIPDGRQVLHRCDVRACVNPDHLFLGTQADNIADMIAKGRKPDLSGEDIGTSKLTEAAVLDIRARYAAGETQPTLAGEFGVSQTNISLIVLGKRWRHLIGGRQCS